MKKSLVLAMAMALGVTASAYAANPFSDVPAGHWAYDSISKLAAAGIIEGYGDDTFRGDRLMTRYEMAQIVAKALAKGANVDKLAAEFADELDALGVRVAALEKKSDNVKITGYFRYQYDFTKSDVARFDDNKNKRNHNSKLRSRIWFNGQVNDNWKYVGMIENNQDLTNNKEDGTVDFQRAYLDGRLGGMKVMAGRFHKKLVEGDLYGHRADGLDFTYGDKVKLNAYYMKPTAKTVNHGFKGNKFDRMYGVNATAGLGKVADLYVGYDRAYNGGTYVDGVQTDNKDLKDSILTAGLKFNLGKDLKFGGYYMHTSPDDDLIETGASKNGFMLLANYKGAKAAKPGSWGLNAKYYHVPAAYSVAEGWDTSDAVSNLYAEGYKGFWVEGRVTVAKNMIAGIQYWDLKGRESGNKNKTTWADFVVTF